MSGAGTQVGALLDIYGFNSSVEVSVLSRRDIRIATHLLLCFHASSLSIIATDVETQE